MVEGVLAFHTSLNIYRQLMTARVEKVPFLSGVATVVTLAQANDPRSMLPQAWI